MKKINGYEPDKWEIIKQAHKVFRNNGTGYNPRSCYVFDGNKYMYNTYNGTDFIYKVPNFEKPILKATEILKYTNGLISLYYEETDLYEIRNVENITKVLYQNKDYIEFDKVLYKMIVEFRKEQDEKEN